MPLAHKVYISGTGSYLPANPVSNEQLPGFDAAAAEMVRQKTGIQRRYFTSDGEATSDIAAKAVERLLDSGKVSRDEVELVICATSTPDCLLPPAAARIQHLVGLRRAAAFDMNAVCSSGVFGLATASAYVASGFYRNIVVVAADTYSKFLNWSDLSTAPYFGDGAGAVMVSSSGDHEVLDVILHTDGSGYELILIPAGGSRAPASRGIANPVQACFKMKGKAVFEFATTRGTEVVKEIMERNKVRPSDVGLVILHQANLRIIEAISTATGIDRAKFVTDVTECANTAGASTLLALDRAVESKRLKKGDLVVMAAFGGGLAWCAGLIQW